MSHEMSKLRAYVTEALGIVRHRQLSPQERLAQVEQLLHQALDVGEQELSTDEVERWLSRPGVAEAIARVQKEGRNGRYFEADEDGRPSNRPMRF